MRSIGNWARRNSIVQNGRRGGELGGRTEGVIDGHWRCGGFDGIIGIASILGSSCISYMARESWCRIISLLLLYRTIAANGS